MCKNCVNKQYPQRGRLCSESGAYLVNFVGCCVCQGNADVDNRGSSTAVLKVVGKQTIKNSNEDSDEDESDDKETIRFEHVCMQCSHVAKHVHEFWVEDGYQEYRMECLLCGQGQDSSSIMPKDPKKMSNNF